MRNAQKRFFSYLVFVGGFIFLIGLLRRWGFFFGPRLYWRANSILSGCIYVTVLMLWMRKISRKIINEKMRSYLLVSALLMIYWIGARTIKYSIVGHPFLSRMLWYSYYLPIVYLPFTAYKMARYLGCGEKYKRPGGFFKWNILAGGLLLAVMTNDFHSLVFRITDYSIQDPPYTYGPGYYVVLLWIMGMTGASIREIVKKSKTMLKVTDYLLPLSVGGIGVLYTVIYMVKTVFFDGKVIVELTAMFCYLYSALWEAFISLGMIPSNHEYKDFFNASSLQAYITDRNGAVSHQSQNTEVLSGEKFEQLREEGKLYLSQEALAEIYPIKEGYVVYEKNLSAVNELIEELQEVKEQLMDEQALAQKRNEAEAARIRIEEKEYLFKLISDTLRPQTESIRYYMRKIKEGQSEEKTLEYWKRILILGTYIKRYGNLLLIGESDSVTTSLELNLSIKQSIENLRLCGINAGMLIEEEVSMDVQWILRCYAAFEKVVEYFFFSLQSVHVVYNQRNGRNTFLVEGSYDGEVKELEASQILGVCPEIEQEDGEIRLIYIWNVEDK